MIADKIQFGRVPYAMIDAGILAEMSSRAVRVYVAILAHAGEGWTARPSIERLMALCGAASERTIQQGVSELVELGVIEADRRGGRGLATVYNVVTDPSKRAQHACAVSSELGRVIDAKRAHVSDTKGRRFATKRAHVSSVKGASLLRPNRMNRVNRAEEQSAGADSRISEQQTPTCKTSKARTSSPMPEAALTASAPPAASATAEDKTSPVTANAREVVSTIASAMAVPRERLRTSADLRRELAQGFKGRRRRPRAEPVPPLSDEELKSRREAARKQAASLKESA